MLAVDPTSIADDHLNYQNTLEGQCGFRCDGIRSDGTIDDGESNFNKNLNAIEPPIKGIYLIAAMILKNAHKNICSTLS